MGSRTRIASACLLAALLTAVSTRAAAPAWTAIGPYGGTVGTLLVDPLHPRTLYAAGSFPAVLKSTDAGASWTALPGSPGGGVVAIDPQSPATLYASTLKEGLARSRDGGSHWARITVDYRFFVQALAVDPARPSRIYLGASRGGVWKSENGGASWISASQGLAAGARSTVTALVAVPRPAGTASNIVFKTTNGGASWTAASNGLPRGKVLALVGAPSDPRTLYVSLPQGIFRTANGGASWTAAGIPAPYFSPIVSLAVDPRAARTVYAGGQQSGLFKTTDGGGHWSAVDTFPSLWVKALAVDATKAAAVYAGVAVLGTDPGGVLRSVDGGASWQPRSQGIPGLDTLAVAADPREPDFLAAGTNGQGLFLSEQGGRIWTRSSLGFTPPSPGSPLTVPQVLFSPAGVPEALYARLLPTLAASTDRGESWSLADLSAPQGAFELLSQDPAAPFHLFALTSSGSPYGLWSGFPGAWTPLTLPCNCYLRHLAVGSRPGSTTPVLYLAGAFRPVGSTLQSPPSSGKSLAKDAGVLNFFRSDDGGASWIDVGAGLPTDAGIQTIAVDPADPEVLYVGFDGAVPFEALHGVWKTTDGGQTWSATSQQIPDASITALGVSPLPGRVYAANLDGKVFRSDDGGASWALWSDGLAVSSVHQFLLDPSDPRHLYAATSGGVWAVEDRD
jgi:photosystem II stability/assembly factor-like uncharacterized protein